jgi:rare lipoprotein A
MKIYEGKMLWPAAIILLAALSLVGCGTTGQVKSEKPQAAPDKRPQDAASSATSSSTSGGKKPGGYYLDDGPGDNPPPDIDAIPDAVPRPEQPLERANRPYMALGENYTPMISYQPYNATGVASWYGRRYHGQKTSSGEAYDMYGMTAAHPILPIPSYVRVTNPENGKSVVVRVNDRGPFKHDRLIDLSYAAAYKLRLTGKGSGIVEVEAIPPTGGNKAAAASPAASPDTSAGSVISSAGSYVQAGAFKSKENADQLRQKLQQQELAGNVAVESWYNDGVYRVRLGPYASRSEAERSAGQIKRALGISTLVVTQ